MHRSVFLSRLPPFLRVLSKLDTFEKLKMADLRWRMVPDPSLTINDAIMTSLLVLKVTNVSTNFLILSDTL